MVGTIVSVERAREVFGERGVSSSMKYADIIERMHAYCLGQNAGVEFLMLLFVGEARDGVVPGALLSGLLGCVAENERDAVWERGVLRAGFARDVSLYVDTL